VFSVRLIEIQGGTPRVRAQVRHALASDLGRSLLRLDAADLDRRLAAVPEVRTAAVDRAFPHTLRVAVTPERPVLLLRRGRDGWVVSARGRVLYRVANTRLSLLPRVWIRPDTQVVVGAFLARDAGAAAAAALAPPAAREFPGGVEFVRVGPRELTFVLHSRWEVRLGDAGDVRLKLAIARRILPRLDPTAGPTYVDVSVPERPVAGSLESRVEG
jgi:cell division protein FtsQ